jgi:hypothetical protein
LQIILPNAKSIIYAAILKGRSRIEFGALTVGPGSSLIQIDLDRNFNRISMTIPVLTVTG